MSARGEVRGAGSGLHLAARVGAARPVDAQRLGDRDALLELARGTLGGGLGLDQRQAAELCAGAADEVADDVARLDGKAGGTVEAGLREQRLERAVVHVGQDDVLLDGQPNLAARVPVGEVGDLPRLGDREAPHRHVHTHARLARLRLRVHAEEGAPLKGAVALGCAFWTLVDISLMTRLRNFSLTRGWPLTSLTSPYSSMSHMSRPFCRSLRPPSSRKMRRMAAVKSVVASTVAGIQTSRSTLSATRLIDM